MYPKENKAKERIKTLVIIILLIVIVILLLKGCVGERKNSAIITKDENVELNDTSSGQIRVKMNSSIDVENDILKNLDFGNYNENRLLKIKIKVDDEYIYESDFIQPGEVLEGDLLKKVKLKEGVSSAIGEVYSYTIDKELIGQTNVVLQLNKEN